MSPLGNIISKRFPKPTLHFHYYADDTWLYLSGKLHQSKICSFYVPVEFVIADGYFREFLFFLSSAGHKPR